MFIEKLWIIEKVAAAAGMSQPLTKGQEKKKRREKTDMKSLFQTLAHKRSRTHIHSHVLRKQDKTYSNVQDETVNHSSYKLESTWEENKSQFHS